MNDALLAQYADLEHSEELLVSGEEALVTAVYRLCEQGVATLLRPDLPTRRPATHLFELELFGVTGRGDTLRLACEDWRKAALRIVRGDEAAGE